MWRRPCYLGHPRTSLKSSSWRNSQAPTNTPQTTPSVMTEPTEILRVMLLSGGQDSSPGPRTNQGPLCDSTGGSTPEVTVGYNQRWQALDHGDEASRPWYFDYSPASMAVLPVCIQLGPQFYFPPCEASKCAGSRQTY
jgi:hypothetical protein